MNMDLTQLQVIGARDIEAAAQAGAKSVTLRAGALLTPSARDAAATRGIAVEFSASHHVGVVGDSGSAAGSGAPTSHHPHAGAGASAAGSGAPMSHRTHVGDGASGAGSGAPMSHHAHVVGRGNGASKNSKWDVVFASVEAQRAKEEIVAVGKKLWARAYVDGNGGNISYRLTDDAVLCTPTLFSKADLTVDDLCLVDLEGKQLAGNRPRTSEILMHLEIYKAVSEAKAVVHCHPPHATAYAITGHVPPNCIIPEMEVFVGRVAVTPYETPGTQSFAETVIPYAKDHNTILLGNHGVVCWADTVTHAEWYAEVLENYCMTLVIASQLGAPISLIPSAKTGDLIQLKEKLGLPDARKGMKECELCEQGDVAKAIAVPYSNPGSCAVPEDDDEALIKAVTDAVMVALGGTS